MKLAPVAKFSVKQYRTNLQMDCAVVACVLTVSTENINEREKSVHPDVDEHTAGKIGQKRRCVLITLNEGDHLNIY